MTGAELTPAIPVHIFSALWVATLLGIGYTVRQARGRRIAWGAMATLAIMSVSAILAALSTTHWPEQSFRLVTVHGLTLTSAVAWLGMSALVTTAPRSSPAHQMMAGAWGRRERTAGILLAATLIVIIGVCNEFHQWSAYHRWSLALAGPAALAAGVIVLAIERRAAPDETTGD